MVIFSFPTFINVRTLSDRQMNIMRLSCDQQLTAMALIQVTFINEYICGLNIQSTNTEHRGVTKGTPGPAQPHLLPLTFLVTPLTEHNVRKQVIQMIIIIIKYCLLKLEQMISKMKRLHSIDYNQ